MLTKKTLYWWAINLERWVYLFLSVGLKCLIDDDNWQVQKVFLHLGGCEFPVGQQGAELAYQNERVIIIISIPFLIAFGMCN